MGIYKMNSTIDYYNRNAESYFERTASIDFSDMYERFIRYIPDGGRIMDLGCGSGRDVKWFIEHGYDARGIDASEELVARARAHYGVPVEVGVIEDWIAETPYDGVWCCASLMHLEEEAWKRFFANLEQNIKSGGAIYISVKSGVQTGLDGEGRYFRNYKEDDIYELVNLCKELEIKELWYSDDSLARIGFRWLNVIATRG